MSGEGKENRKKGKERGNQILHHYTITPPFPAMNVFGSLLVDTHLCALLPGSADRTHMLNSMSFLAPPPLPFFQTPTSGTGILLLSQACDNLGGCSPSSGTSTVGDRACMPSQVMVSAVAACDPDCVCALCCFAALAALHL